MNKQLINKSMAVCLTAFRSYLLLDKLYDTIYPFYQRRFMMKDFTVPYWHVGAAVAVGATISRVILHKESLIENGIDAVMATGTYLISKAALEISRGIRNATVNQDQEQLQALLPGGDPAQRKLKKG